jgi:putative zinc finger protein
MRECLDEGILQSYFDGELAGEMMERVTSHIAACASCAKAARQLENENLLLSEALAPEFEITVPTDRLRRRVDAAIGGLQVVKPIPAEAPTSSLRGWAQSFSALFSFTPQRAFGYAALVIILAFAAVVGLVRWRSASSVVPNRDNVARDQAPAPSRGDESNRPNERDLTGVVVPEDREKTSSSSPPRRRPITQRGGPAPAVARVKLLPGERSYLKTIASLDTTLKSVNERPMRPALRAEYERNLALVDRAIAATRNAAKSNPNDPDAAEFMFAAYQSKVDLLNTVADARLYNR